jgi:hypothetical protein
MSGPAQERLQFISHQDKRILFIDFSHCTAEEILVLLPDIQETITSEPRGSLLTMADFTGAHVSHDAADRIKKMLVFDRPHVKRSALVGVEQIPKVYLDAFKTFSRRDLPSFRTREEALDWLVQDSR